MGVMFMWVCASLLGYVCICGWVCECVSAFLGGFLCESLHESVAVWICVWVSFWVCECVCVSHWRHIRIFLILMKRQWCVHMSICVCVWIFGWLCGCVSMCECPFVSVCERVILCVWVCGCGCETTITRRLSHTGIHYPTLPVAASKWLINYKIVTFSWANF